MDGFMDAWMDGSKDLEHQRKDSLLSCMLPSLMAGESESAWMQNIVIARFCLVESHETFT